MEVQGIQLTEFANKKELLTEQVNGPSSRSLRNRRVVDLAFKNITYTVKSQMKGGADRQVLQNLTGFCPGASVTAILGSSGAGKTSLLNILAARVSNTELVTVTGELLANGQPYNVQKFSSFASYVMQNDVLFETLTPREAFTFVANLKYVDPEIKRRRVDDTVKTMKLDRCQNALIGGISFKGISGGERKRTSIGFELVTNPSCILLDEPTSGLDSFTAFQIINELKNLAVEQDRTIIFTIHQPSSDIFLLFDRIMLLVNGQFIYQGPRSQIIEHFGKAGFQCPTHSNPMDYFISIMHTEDPQNIKNIPLYYQNYRERLALIVDKEIQQSSTMEIEMKRVETSTIYQISMIAARAWNTQFRDKSYIIQKLCESIFMGLLIGGIFWNVGENSGGFAQMNNVAGALFFIAIHHTFDPMMTCLLSFNVEREVFLREENSKLYNVGSYFIGKSCVELPFTIVLPILESLIFYWMCNLNYIEAKFVVIHIFIAILMSLNANSVGLCVGCAFPDITAANTVIDMVFMPLIIFSGFIANPDNFYVWMGWLQYLSPVKYTFEAFSRNEFTDRPYSVDPVKQLNFNVGLWQSIGILIAGFVAVRFFAYFFLKKLTKQLQ